MPSPRQALGPPNIDLVFYRGQTHESETFADVVESLISLGAAANGAVDLWRGERIRQTLQFEGPRDWEAEQVAVSKQDARVLLHNPSVRPVRFYMDDAVWKGIGEYVTWEWLPEGVVGRDWHPIRIVTEGAEPEVDEQRAERVLRRIRNRFESIVNELEPDYGAILSYTNLPTVFELRRSENIESDFVFVHRRIAPSDEFSVDSSHQKFVRRKDVSAGTIIEIRDHAPSDIRSRIRANISNSIVRLVE